MRSLVLAASLTLLSPLIAGGQGGAARVVVAPVEQRELAAGQAFVGTIQPTRTSTVGSAVNGRVEEYLAREGDRVRQGQPLARLRTRIVEAELAAARAELVNRQAELEELENGSRPEEIEQARARLSIAEAMADFRRAKQKRTSLLGGGGASREEVEEAIAMANQADNITREARAALKLLEIGPRKERIAQASARVEEQKAEVERIEEQLARHVIAAPFDGFVVAEHTEVGQWLNQGEPVAEIAELENVDVLVGVLEDYVGYLSEGKTARVEVGALPRETFTGKIVAIVPRGGERTRTFPVKVRVENREQGGTMLLKAGMFARVTLPVGPRQTGLVVPKDALVLGGPAPVVFVVEPDAAGKKLVRPVPVQLGIADEHFIEVKGDLKPGQSVVVQGNERIRPGQEVAVP